MELTDEQNRCFICHEDFLSNSEISAVKEKGFLSLKRTSKEIGDGLFDNVENCENVKLHLNCRNICTSKKNIQALKRKMEQISEKCYTVRFEVFPQRRLRSSVDSEFDWEHNCFICAEPISFKSPFKPLKSDKVFSISKSQTKTTIMQSIPAEPADFLKQVKSRIDSTTDIVSI